MKKPTPKQAFLVLSMFFGTTKEQREPGYKDRRVKALSPVKLRNELVERNVLKTEKREGKSHLLLGEDAHEFVMRELGAPLPDTSAAAPVLAAVLERLGTFLQTHGYSLDEFIGAPPAPALTTHAVREAYLGLTHGEKRRRIRLADLRRHVAASQDVLDATLLTMQAAGQVVLYRLDNSADISPEDERAALYIADQPRHLIYLEA